MDLLTLAKGPLLQWSTMILIAGILWRLVGVLLLRTSANLSEARNTAIWKGVRLLATRSMPRREFFAGTAFLEITGYVFHLGIFVALLFYLPHILFFEDVFKGLLGVNLKDVSGIAWPYLPGGAIYFFGAVSVAALMVVLIHRIASPVKRLISNFDDYFSWFVSIAPLVTGLMAFSHVGAPYQTLLGIHILSVELLMVWFPFGKLMHAFTMPMLRSLTGMRFERKGAAL